MRPNLALPMLLTLLSLLPLAAPTVSPPQASGQAAADATDFGAMWTPLDDPDADPLPQALRDLPNVARSVFRKRGAPRFLLARQLAAGASPFDAFVADEEHMTQFGEFFPETDDVVELAEREVVVFGCDWTNFDVAARIAAAYAETDDGAVRSVWVVGAQSEDPDSLSADAVEALRDLLHTLNPTSGTTHRAILMQHDLSFSLGAGMKSVDTPREIDTKFFKAITVVNPQFSAGIVRQWEDEAAGASLSYQVLATNTGLGPKDPFVYFLAGQLQTYERGNPDDGDAPIEVLFAPEVETRVIDDAELARHFASNKRAPDAGVILEVYLPKFPFARVCQLRWQGGIPGSEEFAFSRLVELREYRRSRSETVARCCVVMITGRAQTAQARDALLAQLDIAAKPLPLGPSFLDPR